MPHFASLQRLPRPAKVAILVLVDALFGGLAFWLAALARTGRVPAMHWSLAIAATTFAMLLVPAIGVACGLYRPVVRFHIPRLSTRVGLVSGLAGTAIAAAGLAGGAQMSLAAGLGAVFALVLFVLIVWSRHSARILLEANAAREGIPVAIYGAGGAGRQLLELLQRSQERSPVFFIDDDVALHGRTIEDIRVLGPRDRNLASRLLSKDVKEILLAIPSVQPARRREILEVLSELPFHVRSVPSLSELVNRQETALAELKDISIEDLLGRETVSPLAGLLEKCVAGKVVLVTGGGGSIGSELCRQVLELRPSRLIVLDHSEFALYQIEQELTTKLPGAGPGPDLNFVLGSVTDPSTLEALLEERRVNTVYHAAAYKHVPMVERNPVEGLRNNLLGTWYIASAAARARVENFVLISSDKAVRPTNVMGATKRMAELVVQVLSEKHPHTVFCMVRFGNVLGSSGSVVPLFKRQIERGGPITLTHPEVTRYFMTIEEAVQLVIQAGAMAKGGEVFVLDMGKPVKIRDLAVKMIRLSGRAPEGGGNPRSEIAIEMVGLRPGEKLYEELLISGDAIGTTHPRIWKAREETVDSLEFHSELERIELQVRASPQGIDVGAILRKWVAGYVGDEK